MIDWAIDIEPLYSGMDICEKIEKVAAAGFHAVEFWGWQDKDITKIRETCEKTGVSVRAFSGMEKYSLCDRDHTEDMVEWIKRSIQTAKMLKCDTLILFPNHFTPSGCADFRDKYSHDAMVANATYTLTRIAPILEENNITALLEPLCNTGADAGMSVTSTALGADIVRAVASPNVKLLCDVFHMQIMHGNLLNNIMSNIDIVPYIHIADVPDRHEPGTGEINFDFLLPAIQESGFEGTICFEYFPEGDTEAGFPAAKRLFDLIK